MKKLIRSTIVMSCGLAVCFLLLSTIPVGAQDHSGHSSGTAKPKAAAQSEQTPKVQASQDIPQVEISPDQQKLIGVKTVKVDWRTLQKVIRTIGRIEADERRLATVNTKIDGWIEKLYVEITGSYVKKGDPLVEIYSPELIATEQEYLNALQWAKRSAENMRKKDKNAAVKDGDIDRMLVQDAAAMLAAARQRLLLWDISAEQIKTIEETGKTIRTLTLFSPVDGFITQKMAVLGTKVAAGEKLFDVADLSTVWVIADIYEYELPLIKVGARAAVSIAYLADKELPSQIDYIYPTISADTRTAKIRLKLANPHNQLKPQMFTDVAIKINMGRRLMIPEAALIDTGNGMVAYVDSGGGFYEPRAVETGLRTDGSIEVISGLKAGEMVVFSANFLIDAEAQLKEVKPLPRQ
jgi:membrane fusion protein, copper/silver efflux system